MKRILRLEVALTLASMCLAGCGTTAYMSASQTIAPVLIGATKCIGCPPSPTPASEGEPRIKATSDFKSGVGATGMIPDQPGDSIWTPRRQVRARRHVLDAFLEKKVFRPCNQDVLLERIEVDSYHFWIVFWPNRIEEVTAVGDYWTREVGSCSPWLKEELR